MDIKKLLQEGCAVSMSYKERKTEWVGEVKIYVFAGGFGMQPKVIVTGNIGNHEFPLEELDVAIDFFEAKVFSPTNLWYGHNEAMTEIAKTNPDIDLEIDEDFEEYESLRLKIISHK